MTKSYEPQFTQDAATRLVCVYSDFCNTRYVREVFQNKEQLRWAYKHRHLLEKITVEELFEVSPFMEYANDIFYPLHIRFAAVQPKEPEKKK